MLDTSARPLIDWQSSSSRCSSPLLVPYRKPVHLERAHTSTLIWKPKQHERQRASEDTRATVCIACALGNAGAHRCAC